MFTNKQFKASLLSLTAFLAINHVSQAIVIRHDVADQDYIDLAEPFDAVTLVDTFFAGFGSATLVSPTKVITAAHVVEPFLTIEALAPEFESSYTLLWGNGGNVSPLTSPTVTRSFGGGGIASYAFHPEWTGDVNTSPAYADIAILTLSDPVTSITPISISAANPNGMFATTVGYGATGTGDISGPFTSDQLRRGANNTIDVISELGRLQADFDSPAEDTNRMGSATPLALEGTAAPGDSGGGIFVDFGSGLQLVGVVSSGTAIPNSGNDVGSYGTRVNYAGFYNNTAFLIANGVAVPEPTTSILLTIATFGLLTRRVRK